MTVLPAAIPAAQKKRLIILGSTGTIGVNALKLLQQHPERFELAALVAGDNVELLIEQARSFLPEQAVIANESHYQTLKDALQDTDVTVSAGPAAVLDAAAMEAGVVLSAIVGAAGLEPTLKAIRSGSAIALANKESLVCAGALMMKEAQKHHATLIPVDSEHNGLYQLFNGLPSQDIDKITLTASGGPFREWSFEQMQHATPEQAVNHPNWHMGAKISVDSATMMNKGLEMIEAYHLFPVTPEQIDVLVHPQSVVHCLVQMVDGSVLAQLSQPDMCIPIAHALAWPERITTLVTSLDLAKIGSLQFEKPDESRFPALRLAKQALHAGGSAACVLNAANEVAVQQFLDGTIPFTDITKRVEQTLEIMDNTNLITLEDVLACDMAARNTAKGL